MNAVQGLVVSKGAGKLTIRLEIGSTVVLKDPNGEFDLFDTVFVGFDVRTKKAAGVYRSSVSPREGGDNPPANWSQEAEEF